MGSSGQVETRASSPAWRRRTARHSVVGSATNASPGRDVDDVPRAGVDLGLELAAGPPGVPGEDPQVVEAAADQLGRGVQVDQPDRSLEAPPADRRCSTASTRARPSALSRATGPPWNSTCGDVARVCQVGRTSPTGTGVARFTTTPSAPSSSCCRIEHDACGRSSGRARSGVATSSRPTRLASLHAAIIAHRRDARSAAPAAARRAAPTRSASASVQSPLRPGSSSVLDDLAADRVRDQRRRPAHASAARPARRSGQRQRTPARG